MRSLFYAPILILIIFLSPVWSQSYPELSKVDNLNFANECRTNIVFYLNKMDETGEIQGVLSGGDHSGFDFTNTGNRKPPRSKGRFDGLDIAGVTGYGVTAYSLVEIETDRYSYYDGKIIALNENGATIRNAVIFDYVEDKDKLGGWGVSNKINKKVIFECIFLTVIKGSYPPPDIVIEYSNGSGTKRIPSWYNGGVYLEKGLHYGGKTFDNWVTFATLYGFLKGNQNFKKEDYYSGNLVLVNGMDEATFFHAYDAAHIKLDKYFLSETSKSY